MTKILLQDDFSDLDIGPFSVEVGAHTEYHYLPEAAPKGNWTVACFKSGTDAGRAWKVIRHNNSHVMAQTFENNSVHTHPMLSTGDVLWQDYTARVRITPQVKQGQVGVAFRFKNSRCYYFFGLNEAGLVLKSVEHETEFHVPDEKVLAELPYDWQPNQEYTLHITAQGQRLTGEIENIGKLEANDDRYPQGNLAVMSDAPALFHEVQVTADEAEISHFNLMKSKQERELEDLRAANPKPVLWKKISTKGFGVGRNLRFGDLTGNGEVDVLIGQMVHHGPRDQYSELSCLTAMTFDGDMLWQIGKPDPANYHLTNDVAFQIHDIDGDGLNEVIYCMNFEIVVLDGATGKVKYKAPTPRSKAPANRYENILGDCLFFCDLRGLGADRDIIIKDRYWHFWALNDKLEIMWEGSCRTGHYPYAADIDGDGHDELAIGFSMFDHDGKMLWTLEDQIQDHADGVAIVNFMQNENSEPQVFYTASDSGVVFADLKGNIINQYFIGHAQNPAIADFRPDLPGLEVVSINFWGNQGILHFFDPDGKIYHDVAPNPFGSMCLPINWTGQPGELFVHSPNVKWGGMFDAWGRSVVMFPDDGHPDMCNAVLDLTGDCRDEVVVWDQNELWVYTQDDNPKSGKLYKPTRNPLYNYSNYQASVSLPGWSE